MNIRTFSTALLGSLAAIAFMPAAAQAAVTVIGSGPAQLCYDGAENGGDPMEYITYCNQAINSILSPRDRAATFINRGVLKLALAEAH